MSPVPFHAFVAAANQSGPSWSPPVLSACRGVKEGIQFSKHFAQLCHEHLASMISVSTVIRSGSTKLAVLASSWPRPADHKFWNWPCWICKRHVLSRCKRSSDSSPKVGLSWFVRWKNKTNFRKPQLLQASRLFWTLCGRKKDPELFGVSFFFQFCFFDFLFCLFSLLFAAFWSWKLPFQRYLQHFGVRTSHFPQSYLQHFGAQNYYVAWSLVCNWG